MYSIYTVTRTPSFKCYYTAVLQKVCSGAALELTRFQITHIASQCAINREECSKTQGYCKSGSRRNKGNGKQKCWSNKFGEPLSVMTNASLRGSKPQKMWDDVHFFFVSVWIHFLCCAVYNRCLFNKLVFSNPNGNKKKINQ